MLGSDLVASRDGHAALLDDSTAENRGSSDNLLVLDAEDAHAVANPVEGNVSEDVDEANKGNDKGDTGVGSISDSTLDRGEDGTARDTHDEDTGTATGVLAKVGSSEGEDGGVHGSLEEVDDDEDCDSRSAVASADVCVEGNGANRVDGDEEVALEDGSKASSDETTDSEDNEGV